MQEKSQNTAWSMKNLKQKRKIELLKNLVWLEKVSWSAPKQRALELAMGQNARKLDSC
ncbi:hypothetical protein LR48_Vigan09g101400 [Vigna angularis]|uniref:Uncharacterized protein n=1 Tax=Phaseolus angularis TaxID=3914 RepID=A0A0L9VBB7_PHAAN|nr:hypothetical protein LR48_Vigan09g101400 [Vigna angularis]